MRNRRRGSGHREAAVRLKWYLGAYGALLSGCGAQTDGAPTEQEASGPSGPELASVGNPVEGATINGSLPPLPGQTTNVAGGYMTTWPELIDAPKNLDASWYAAAIGDAYTTPKVFESQLRSAVAQATEGVKRDSVGIPAALATVTKFLPNGSVDATDYRSFGYKPERARWLKQVSTGADDGNRYDDPPHFGEMRARGARLYCAAKSAALHQSEATKLMGETSIVDTKILGAHLKLLTIEPTLTMQNPLRIDTDKTDGAQAFVLPFTAGLRITPVSFLPSLPELRVPLAMVSADAEVISTEKNGSAYSKWLTMSHVDGFSSVAQSMHVSSGKFALFAIGPVVVSGEIKVDLGMAACTQGSTYDACKRNGAQQVGRLIAGVQDSPSGVLSPLPTPAREGGWTTPGFMEQGAYSDAPWNIETTNWISTPTTGIGIFTRLPDPLAMRMLQNNDKSLEIQSDASINFKLSGGLPIDLGKWVTIYPNIAGNLGAGATLIHRFREQEETVQLEPKLDQSVQEFLIPTPAMVTTFTVTPLTAGHFDFGTSAGFDVHIKDLPFVGTLEVGVDLWNFQKSVPIGARKAWPEVNRLRMDNAISDATVAHFGTTSHWPGGSAFPTYEAWDACQPSDTRSTTPPAACVGREPADGTFAKNVSTSLCFYTTAWDFPPDYTTGPELDCMNALQPLLTRGVVKRQSFRGDVVDAHLLDSANYDAEFDAVKQASAVCLQSFGDAGRLEEGKARINFHPCDSAATLNDGGFSADSVETPPGLGGTGQAGSCH